MEQIRVIGLDIAKSVFQVHGVDGEGEVVVRRRLRRSRVVPFFASIEPCLVGIEACATSHFWARELGAPGHDVKLMPPAYVKTYVKRQKNDAEAICEAVTRPTMRFVPEKLIEKIEDETDEQVPAEARLCLKMLVVGAMAVIRYAQETGGAGSIEHAPVPEEIGKGDKDVMRSTGRYRETGKPSLARASSNACF